MPGNPDVRLLSTPEGRRLGGINKAKRHLSLDKVEAQLGVLETPEDAMRHLKLLANWVCCGMLTGIAASAAVRAIEVWLRGHDEKVIRVRLKELESQLKAYQKQGRQA